MIRELVVRKRRDDGNDEWLGYDEYIDAQPTGKIVMGWHRDPDGNTVYDYVKHISEVEDYPEETEKQSINFEGAVERFVVSFDWHYGTEEYVFDSLAEIASWRKAVEAKFGHLEPTNWKVRRETVIMEDIEWPA